MLVRIGSDALLGTPLPVGVHLILAPRMEIKDSHLSETYCLRISSTMTLDHKLVVPY